MSDDIYNEETPFMKQTKRLREVEKERDELKQKLEIAVEALKFYGNEDIYFDEEIASDGTIFTDSTANTEFGFKARKALEKIKPDVG